MSMDCFVAMLHFGLRKCPKILAMTGMMVSLAIVLNGVVYRSFKRSIKTKGDDLDYLVLY